MKKIFIPLTALFVLLFLFTAQASGLFGGLLDHFSSSSRSGWTQYPCDSEYTIYLDSASNLLFGMYTDQTAYIAGVPKGFRMPETLYIPAFVEENVPVSVVGEYAFYANTQIKHVIVPEGVEQIDTGAFQESSLQSIVLPDSLTSIEYDSFFSCANLKSICFPENLEFIGETAFAECTSLSSLVFPDSLDTIRFDAFLGCTSLKTVSIGKGLLTLDGNVFFSCPMLENITVHPDNPVFYIKEGALYNRDKRSIVCYPAKLPYTSFTADEGILTVENGCFGDVNNLQELFLPDCIEVLEDFALYGCVHLSYFEWGPYLRQIGYAAIPINSMSGMHLPSSVASMAEYALFERNDFDMLYDYFFIVTEDGTEGARWADANGVDRCTLSEYNAIKEEAEEEEKPEPLISESDILAFSGGNALKAIGTGGLRFIAPSNQPIDILITAALPSDKLSVRADFCAYDASVSEISVACFEENSQNLRLSVSENALYGLDSGTLRIIIGEEAPVSILITLFRPVSEPTNVYPSSEALSPAAFVRYEDGNTDLALFPQSPVSPETKLEVLGEIKHKWYYVRYAQEKNTLYGFVPTYNTKENPSEKRGYVIVSPDLYSGARQYVFDNIRLLFESYDISVTTVTPAFYDDWKPLMERIIHQQSDFNDITYIYLFAHGSERLQGFYPTYSHIPDNLTSENEKELQKQPELFHCVTYESFLASLDQVPGRIVLIMDSCRCGRMLDYLDSADMEKYTVILSCGPDQDTQQYPSYSLFSKSLLSGFETGKNGFAKADKNMDGKINLLELSESCPDHVYYDSNFKKLLGFEGNLISPLFFGHNFDIVFEKSK